MQEIADQRGVPVDALKDFSGYINGALAHQSDEQKAIWASKQTYIALGFGLVRLELAKKWMLHQWKVLIQQQ
jgi:hypothetical protein